ncbi:UNKNOWN [Stylonychia lemnae]|uniref:Uncharacterized protein n=1 Tax=Stylonychia lemnae TaxID=5949 RepID=A0A078A8A3_STYLE|nr:UNKNOWN [Stylonychia lemnae]|eukprot:CDW78454.1 UNKNOWN [Stylonychia lemnae]
MMRQLSKGYIASRSNTYNLSPAGEHIPQMDKSPKRIIDKIEYAKYTQQAKKNSSNKKIIQYKSQNTLQNSQSTKTINSSRHGNRDVSPMPNEQSRTRQFHHHQQQVNSNKQSKSKSPLKNQYYKSSAYNGSQSTRNHDKIRQHIQQQNHYYETAININLPLQTRKNTKTAKSGSGARGLSTERSSVERNQDGQILNQNCDAQMQQSKTPKHLHSSKLSQTLLNTNNMNMALSNLTTGLQSPVNININNNNSNSGSKPPLYLSDSKQYLEGRQQIKIVSKKSSTSRTRTAAGSTRDHSPLNQISNNSIKMNKQNCNNIPISSRNNNIQLLAQNLSQRKMKSKIQLLNNPSKKQEQTENIKIKVQKQKTHLESARNYSNQDQNKEPKFQGSVASNFETGSKKKKGGKQKQQQNQVSKDVFGYVVQGKIDSNNRVAKQNQILTKSINVNGGHKNLVKRYKSPKQEMPKINTQNYESLFQKVTRLTQEQSTLLNSNLTTNSHSQYNAQIQSNLNIKSLMKQPLHQNNHIKQHSNQDNQRELTFESTSSTKGLTPYFSLREAQIFQSSPKLSDKQKCYKNDQNHCRNNIQIRSTKEITHKRSNTEMFQYNTKELANTQEITINEEDKFVYSSYDVRHTTGHTMFSNQDFYRQIDHFKTHEKLKTSYQSNQELNNRQQTVQEQSECSSREQSHHQQSNEQIQTETRNSNIQQQLQQCAIVSIHDNVKNYDYEYPAMHQVDDSIMNQDYQNHSQEIYDDIILITQSLVSTQDRQDSKEDQVQLIQIEDNNNVIFESNDSNKQISNNIVNNFYDINSPTAQIKEKKNMDMPLQMTSAKKPCLINKDNNITTTKSSVKKRVTINLDQNQLTEFDRPSSCSQSQCSDSMSQDQMKITSINHLHQDSDSFNNQSYTPELSAQLRQMDIEINSMNLFEIQRCSDTSENQSGLIFERVQELHHSVDNPGNGNIENIIKCKLEYKSQLNVPSLVENNSKIVNFQHVDVTRESQQSPYEFTEDNSEENIMPISEIPKMQEPNEYDLEIIQSRMLSDPSRFRNLIPISTNINEIIQISQKYQYTPKESNIDDKSYKSKLQKDDQSNQYLPLSTRIENFTNKFFEEQSKINPSSTRGNGIAGAQSTSLNNILSSNHLLNAHQQLKTEQKSCLDFTRDLLKQYRTKNIIQ